MLLRECPGDALELGVGILNGHAGLQASEGQRVAAAAGAKLDLHGPGLPVVLGAKRPELPGHDAHDLGRAFADRDFLADDVPVTAKATHPHSMADDEGAGGAGERVFRDEEAAQHGTGAEQPEEVGGNLAPVDHFGRIAGERHARPGVERQVIERAGPVPPVEKVGG